MQVIEKKKKGEEERSEGGKSALWYFRSPVYTGAF